MNNKIQIDMFEVQLGSALLLQFDAKKEIVTILADAGIDAPEYPIDHVHKKLSGAFENFGRKDRRIDLIIGTHYDTDHIKGLVPIINDTSIEIGEVWLPPVLNDTEHLDGLASVIKYKPDKSSGMSSKQLLDIDTGDLFKERLDEHRYLACQFALDENYEVLKKYLSVKKQVCEYIRSLEEKTSGLVWVREHNIAQKKTLQIPPDNKSRIKENQKNHPRTLSQRNIDKLLGIPHKDDKTREDNREPTIGILSKWLFPHKLDAWDEEINANNAESYFNLHLAEMEIEDKTNCIFTTSEEEEVLNNIRYKYTTNKNISSLKLQSASDLQDDFINHYLDNPNLADCNITNLMYIRRAAAKDAINAAALSQVVKSLQARGIPFKCQVINNGIPRRFVWKSKIRSFFEGDRLKSDGPVISLLGPSISLVKKHYEKLPYIASIRMAMQLTIPVKSITTSNQLSYILHIKQYKQGILVSGDAGCVDFLQKKNEYYPDLLKSMLPLHIIQVAHHAGNNAHFYRVLMHAGYPKQHHSYLLISHACEDKHRPSEEFGLFINEVAKKRNDVQLLFTSTPLLEKIFNYKRIIHQPVGTVDKFGDVQICFNDIQNWHVNKHAIQI